MQKSMSPILQKDKSGTTHTKSTATVPTKPRRGSVENPIDVSNNRQKQYKIKPKSDAKPPAKPAAKPTTKPAAKPAEKAGWRQITKPGKRQGDWEFHNPAQVKKGQETWDKIKNHVTKGTPPNRTGGKKSFPDPKPKAWAKDLPDLKNKLAGAWEKFKNRPAPKFDPFKDTNK